MLRWLQTESEQNKLTENAINNNHQIWKETTGQKLILELFLSIVANSFESIDLKQGAMVCNKNEQLAIIIFSLRYILGLIYERIAK